MFRVMKYVNVVMLMWVVCLVLRVRGMVVFVVENECRLLKGKVKVILNGKNFCESWWVGCVEGFWLLFC